MVLLLWAVGHLFLFMLWVVLTFQFPGVSDWALRGGLSLLREGVGLHMEASALRLGFPLQVEMDDVVIYDGRGDTIISAERAQSSLRYIGSKGRTIYLGATRLWDGFFCLNTPLEGETNLRSFLNTLRKKKKKGKQPFELRIESIDMQKGRFVMHNARRLAARAAAGKDIGERVDFSDLDLCIQYASLKRFQVLGKDVRAEVDTLSFCDSPSGFTVSNLTGSFDLSSRQMNYSSLRILAEGSELNLERLVFNYSRWRSLRSFVDSVQMDVNILPSIMRPSILAYFAKLPKGLPDSIMIRGGVIGRVNALRISELALQLKDGIDLAFSGSVDGLPEMEEMMFNLDITRLYGSLPVVERVVSNVRGRRFVFPKNFRQVGQLNYRGTVLGFLEDLVVYGDLDTQLGRVSMDVSLGIRRNRPLLYRGRVVSNGLHLGRLFEVKGLGHTVFHVKLDGDYAKHSGMRTHVEGRVPSLDYRGYTYRGITMEGYITPKSYIGLLSIADSAIRFDFDGEVDFNRTLPTFRFNASLEQADLHAMHLVKDTTAQLSFRMKALFEGKNLDNIEGNIDILDCDYRNSKGHLHYDSVSLRAENQPRGKLLHISSPALTGRLYGELSYGDLIPSLHRALSKRFPALYVGRDSLLKRTKGVVGDSLSMYRAEVRFLDPTSLFSTFLPSAYVARGSALYCDYAPVLGVLNFHLKSDTLGYRRFGFSDVSLQSRMYNDSLTLAFVSTKGLLSGLEVDSMYVRSSVSVDTAESESHLLLPGRLPADLRLDWESTFHAADSIYPLWCLVELNESSLLLGEDRWSFSRGRFIIDSSGVDVSDFSLSHGDHRLWCNGRVGKGQKDVLQVGFSQLDLALFSPFWGEKIEPAGFLQGQFNGTALLDSMRSFGCDLQVEAFRFNGAHVGDLSLSGSWRGGSNPVSLTLRNVSSAGQENVSLQARYNMQGKELEADLQMNAFPLEPLGYVISGFMRKPERGRSENELDLTGGLSASMHIGGSLKNVGLNGWLSFDDANVKIRSINGDFNTSSRIDCEGRVANIKGFTLRDQQGGTLQLDGTVEFHELTKPHFDIVAQSERFRFMNTNTLSQLPYYGQVILTGMLGVKGHAKNLRLETALRTEQGTNVSFELPSSKVARETRQLSFVLSPEDSAAKLHTRVDLDSLQLVGRKLTLDLALQLTNEALTQVIVNPRTGDMLKLRGRGDLRLSTANDRRELLLYGDYQIARGDYLFSLEGLLAKKFRIKEGSTIKFSGVPKQGALSITAVYRTRASMEKLAGGVGGEKYKRRIPVECKIGIGGTVAVPILTFSIAVPQADPESQGLLAVALNSEEKVMRQFASLLVLNQFSGDSRGGGQMVTSGGADGTTVSNSQDGTVAGLSDALLASFWELFSSQLNNWLSHLNNAPTIDLGFNYRPGKGMGEYSKDEAEVSVSMQWFGGKLNIDANWDVNRNNTTSAVAGDIVVTQQSHYVPGLRYKAFAQSNDNLVFNDLGPFTAGAGIVYSDSFDSWIEAFKRRWAIRRKKETKGAKADSEKVGTGNATPPEENPRVVEEDEGEVE